MKLPSGMTRLASILLAAFVVLALSSNAFAEPKRANGAACGKDEQGNKMNCQWDTCTYSECTTPAAP